MNRGIGEVLALLDGSPNLSEIFAGLDRLDLRQDLLAKKLERRFLYFLKSNGIGEECGLRTLLSPGHPFSVSSHNQVFSHRGKTEWRTHFHDTGYLPPMAADVLR